MHTSLWFLVGKYTGDQILDSKAELFACLLSQRNQTFLKIILGKRMQYSSCDVNFCAKLLEIQDNGSSVGAIKSYVNNKK